MYVFVNLTLDMAGLHFKGQMIFHFEMSLMLFCTGNVLFSGVADL